tara:strand:- start:512 stop:1384 length:873 start_codon:yes stop_codon:yes gene_type:complete
MIIKKIKLLLAFSLLIINLGCEKETVNPAYIAIQPNLNTKNINYNWEIKEIHLDKSVSHKWIKDTYEANKVPYIFIKKIEYLETDVFIEELLDGIYDQELRQLSRAAKIFKFPLFANFLPLNKYHDISPEMYKKAYTYVIQFCRRNKSSNIYWTFEYILERKSKNFDYFPGNNYIKWVTLSTQKESNIDLIKSAMIEHKEKFPENFILDDSLTNLFKSNNEILNYLKLNTNIIGLILNPTNYQANIQQLSKKKIFNQKNDNLEYLIRRNNIENEILIEKLGNKKKSRFID